MATPLWLDLDLKECGAKLVLAVLASKHLRHAHISSTAQDYLHSDTNEGRFVKDVLSSGMGGPETSELIDKWFGGDECAGKLCVSLLEANPIEE